MSQPLSKPMMICHSSWCLLLLSLVLTTTGAAQRLTHLHTVYSDSFREWIITTDDPDVVGELSLRWPAPDQWGEWTYRLGEESGRLRLRWPNRLDEWEGRGNNAIATARQVWRNDPRSWRLTSPHCNFTWTSVYGNIPDEWQVEQEQSCGYLGFYTEYEGDPRNWVIVDELEAPVTLVEKLLPLLLALYHSVPHQ